MFSFTLSARVRAVAGAAMLVIATDRAHADPQFQVVRVQTPLLAEAFDLIYSVSPTVHAIVDELERSNLIIHVRGMGMDLTPRFTGTMRFVHAAGERRFLRITVNERLSFDRRAAALAHELQHALEVARASSVIDHASFGALYKRIGHESGDDPNMECYETRAAQKVGARALADLRMAASATNGSKDY